MYMGFQSQANDAELDQCVMYTYLSGQPSPGGGEVDL